jgi:hypothetical protein
MKHPFDKEAVEAAIHKNSIRVDLVREVLDVALQAAWDSMFARGKFIGDPMDRNRFYIATSKEPTS